MPTLKELREVARDLGIPYSNKNKAELVEAIEAHEYTESLVKKAKAKVDEAEAAGTTRPSRRPRKANVWHAYLKQKRESTGCSPKEAMTSAKDDYAEFKANWLAKQEPKEDKAPTPAPEAEAASA